MNQDDRTRGAAGLPADVHNTLNEMDEAEARELARTWQLAALADNAAEDTDRHRSALGRFQSVIGADEAVERDDVSARFADRISRHRTGRRPALRRAGAVAAAAVVCLVAVALLRPRTVTLSAPAGEVVEETLPDGSHVVVGPSSLVTYQRGLLADARHVELDGEAFFSVAEDERTFRVETFNATVTALGTSFNVRAASSGTTPSTRVALATGSVKLIPHGAEEHTVWLRPGEVSEVDRRGVPTPPRTISVEAEASWRTGGFALLNQPLSAAVEQLERRFGVDIELRSRELARDTLTISLPAAESAEAVLGDICAVKGCRFQRDAGTIVIEAGS